MTFSIFFPKQGQEDSAYKYLDGEEEIYEVVKGEVRQSISDMGSDGYELICPDFPWEASSGNSYASEEELSDSDTQRLMDLEEYTQLCHERGIDQQASLWAPEIFKDLWIRYRVGIGTGPEGEDIAVNDITYAKLPDGVTIALREDN